jgi:hypothetical protein
MTSMARWIGRRLWIPTASRGLGIVAALSCSLVLPACGVISSSSDCTQRATCTDDDGAADAADETTDDGMAETGADATNEVGDEADASDDTTEGAVPDGATDGGGEEALKDVGSEEAPPIDACGGPENCTNGIDDNCDGKIDCADPQCAAYACVPPVPAGWTGPVAWWQAANPSTAPACPGQYGTPINVSSGLGALPPTCGACSCSVSTQPTCAATGTFHVDQMCQSPCQTATTVILASTGTCTMVATNTCGSGGSFSLAPSLPTPTGGACKANPGTKTVSPPTWALGGRVCPYAGANDSGGCPVTDSCVAIPGGSYGRDLCVYSTKQPAPTSCPPGYNTNTAFPQTFYQSVTDTRDCTACGCASTPSAGTCSGSVSIYGSTANGCSGTVAATVAFGAGCTMYSGAGLSPGWVQATYAVNGAACGVTGQPTQTGSAMSSQPITVCCM